MNGEEDVKVRSNAATGKPPTPCAHARPIAAAWMFKTKARTTRLVHSTYREATSRAFNDGARAAPLIA